jgi:F-type H+-transporting ATPase subunit b
MHPAPVPFADSGSFLITPNVGIMVWTLVVFVISLLILRKWVFPLIGANLDKRAKAISDEIDAADQLKVEANKVLVEYRERLQEARVQAEEIIERARKAGDAHLKAAEDEAVAARERGLEDTQRQIEAATRQAVDSIRTEVANLTVMATERLMRKSLTGADHQRLVEEALSELDFSSLSGGSQ